MAWVEPFFAAVNAVSSSFPALFQPSNFEEKRDLRTYDNNHSNEINIHPSNSDVHTNAYPTTMYQRFVDRAITLQNNNAPEVNEQILDFARSPSRQRMSKNRTRKRPKISSGPSCTSPSFEPMLSASNNPSDFEYDSDSSTYSCFSSVSFPFNNDDHRNISNNNNNGVLSEEEYVEFHRRMNMDELRFSLYENDDENDENADMNARNETVMISIENNKKKLSEMQWKKLIGSLRNKNANCLDLNDIILDEMASKYISKIMRKKTRKNGKKIEKLVIRNAYFANNKDGDSLNLFTQNEGIEDNDNDSNCETPFDFELFCKSILRNKEMKEIVINQSNLNDIIQCKGDIFINLIAKHNGLRRMDFSGNNITNASIFADALMIRNASLECLNLSYNPIKKEDMQSIEWAAQKPFGINVDFHMKYPEISAICDNTNVICKKLIFIAPEGIYNKENKSPTPPLQNQELLTGNNETYIGNDNGEITINSCLSMGHQLMLKM